MKNEELILALKKASSPPGAGALAGDLTGAGLLLKVRGRCVERQDLDDLLRVLRRSEALSEDPSDFWIMRRMYFVFMTLASFVRNYDDKPEIREALLGCIKESNRIIGADSS
jgi:hypothetical protein